MPKFVQDNLVLIAISVLTGVPAILYSFTSHLGLGYFAADLLVGSLLAVLAITWFWSVRRLFKSEEANLFFGPSALDKWKQMEPVKRFDITSRTTVAIAGAIYAAITLSMPLSTIRAQKWEVCATVEFSCISAVCPKFGDSRGRIIDGNCIDIDASGFLSKHTEHNMSYLPKSLNIICDEQKYSAEVGSQHLDSKTCDAKFVLERVE